MDALEAILGCVNRQAVTCDIYRDTGNGPYDDTLSDTGETVDIAIFAPNSQSQVVVEGSGQETSFTGHIVPEYDANGNLVDPVRVNDELRPQNTTKRYDVRVKDGVPNEMDPEIWQLGLDRANASE